MLITMKHTGKHLEFGKHVNVLIPDSKPPKHGFKVLYVLHGYYGDFTDWLYLSNIIRYDRPNDLMLVFPDASNSYYVDHPKGLQYASYIVNDLVELIEQTFHVSSKREDRYIVGLSMGGYGALYLGLKYAHLFSRVYSLSGVVYPSDIVKHLSESRIYKFETMFDVDNLSQYDLLPYAKESVLNHATKLMLICGKQDFLYQDNLQFHQTLVNHDIHHVWIEDEGTHNWDFWDTHIKTVLMDLKK